MNYPNEMKRFITETKHIVITILLTISLTFFTAFNDVDFEIVKNLDIYYTLFKELNSYYVDNINPGELVKKSIDDMLESLDPYTNYIPESRIEDYQFMTTGQYGGVGASVVRKDGKIIITDVYENAPAQKAGLRAGDIVIAIDNHQTEGKTTEQISEYMKGQPGTFAELTIKRPTANGLKDTVISIGRDKITIGNVPYYGMVSDSVGYIVLSQFTEESAAHIQDALKELKEKNNAKSLILDLRFNPGGLLIEAVDIVNLFVKRGQEVVSTRGKSSQWNKSFKARNTPFDLDIPIVVMINSGSASASEIVSGALQDLDRAVVLGQRSFGKGLVQITRDLTYNCKLKVTTAKYYIPSGRCIQALDYSHRNPDGSVGHIPDSLISKFKTLNGRTVYDGGGVIPDLVTETNTPSKITSALFQQYLIFDFATQYILKHQTIDSPKKYKFSETDWNSFVSYIKEQKFDYKTTSAESLDKLIEVAKEEKYYDKSEQEFNALKSKLAADKEKDLVLFKDEIVKYLQDEIVARYYFQKGRIESSLANDTDIRKAVSMLSEKDLTTYKSILNGTYKEKK